MYMYVVYVYIYIHIYRYMYIYISRIYNFQGTFAGKPVACNMVWPALRMAVCPSKICSIGRNMRHRWHIGSRCRSSESVVVQVLLQRALRDGWDMLGWVFLQNSPDVTVSINQTSENSDPQGPEKMGKRKGIEKSGDFGHFFWSGSILIHGSELGLQLQGLSRFSPTCRQFFGFPNNCGCFRLFLPHVVGISLTQPPALCCAKASGPVLLDLWICPFYPEDHPRIVIAR